MEVEQNGPDVLDSTVVVESVTEEIEPQQETAPTDSVPAQMENYQNLPQFSPSSVSEGSAVESQQDPENLLSSAPTDSVPAQVENDQNCPQFSPSSVSEASAAESQQHPENLPSSAPTDSVPVQVENYQNLPQFSPSSASASEVSAVESQQDPDILPSSAPTDSVPVQVGSYQNRQQLFSPSSASDVSAVESDPDFSAHASVSRSASGSGDPARIEEDFELISKFEQLVLDKQQQQQKEMNSVPSIVEEVPEEVTEENIEIAPEPLAEANETSADPAKQNELEDPITGNPEGSLESVAPRKSEEPITPKNSVESVEFTVGAPERIEALIEETAKVNPPESVQGPELNEDFYGTSGAVNEEKIEALNEINEKEVKPDETVNEPEVVDKHMHETPEIVNEEKTESENVSDMNDESPAEMESTNEQTLPIKDDPINEREANEEPVIPRKSYDLSFLDRLEDAEFATPPGLKPGKTTKSPNPEKSPIEEKPAGKFSLLKY